MRILFLVRSLDLGGAERQLVTLARGLQAQGHEVSIAVFYAGGRFEPELRASNIVVHDLGKRGRWEAVRFVARLTALVRSVRPDILHAYMEANVFAASLKPLFPSTMIVWGIRSAKADFRKYGRVARLYPRLESFLGRIPDGIIVNSNAARVQAIRNGLASAKITVVPNGIDCDAFRPDPEGGRKLRAKWGIPEGGVVVGMVARLDPVKNHANFIKAAARVAATRGDTHFVCITDPSARRGYHAELVTLAESLGIAGRLTWAEEGKVSRTVYSALDVVVLASNVGESFPNVIGEAMACGRPTVSTDSGDAAVIIGDRRYIAPPGEHVALARCIVHALNDLAAGKLRSEDLRQRIVAEYSLALLASRTERALDGFEVRRLQPAN